ncbi:MAG: hypothetical protein L6Q95_18095, partial [Planctomycetes bacterium]|nr:hypothetical protein [Planctomycetota bacterium]
MHQRIQGERATLSRGGPAGAFAPLRVGLVVDSAVQPAWAARLVSEIEASAFARVVVLAAARCDARAEPLHRRLWRGLLHDLYLRLDEGFFPGDPDALAPTDLRPLLPGCPVVEVSPGDVERLRGHGLDIAIVLSRALRPADCARIARHGAWSLRGSTGSGAEAASGMLEVLRAEGSTAVEIDAWTAAGRRVVARSRGPTETVSVRCNRDRLFWKGSALLLRGLRDLAERGAVAADA